MTSSKKSGLFSETMKMLTAELVDSKGYSEEESKYLTDSLKEYLSSRINSTYYELLSEEQKKEVWDGIPAMHISEAEMQKRWFLNLSSYIIKNPSVVDPEKLYQKVVTGIVPGFVGFLVEKGVKSDVRN